MLKLYVVKVGAKDKEQVLGTIVQSRRTLKLVYADGGETAFQHEQDINDLFNKWRAEGMSVIVRNR